jgi:hypothetical protein
MRALRAIASITTERQDKTEIPDPFNAVQPRLHHKAAITKQ